VSPEQQYQYLVDEVQRLRAEQQRLRDEQEKLRREHASPSGSQSSSPQQNGGQNQREPRDENKQNESKQTENEQREHQLASDQNQERDWRKPPLKTRTRRFVRTHRKGVFLGAVGFVALVFLSVLLILYLRSYESTDDAQVDGHLNSISPRISGNIVAVYVENNQFVNAGQPLVDLDPQDYQLSLDQAKAAYTQALAAFRAEHPNVPIIQTTNETTISTSTADVAAAEAAVAAAQQDYEARVAALRQAQANSSKAQRDVERYQPLVQRQEISHEQFDTISVAAKAQAAAVDAAQAAADAAKKAIDQSKAQLRQAQSRFLQANTNAPRTVAAIRAQLAMREAAMLAARAQEDQAVLNLSYTKIVAPVSGIVGQRTAEIGQHVPAGDPLLTISQIDDIWITANFKETQLRKMRVGQPVDINVDAFNVTYHGFVENLPGATGSVASLLPPENATGNFVKVVQRLPVRIRLNQGQDPDHRLRIGMSVEPKVWLK
jgi:membrane fusion protein, multidrug efflux system